MTATTIRTSYVGAQFATWWEMFYLCVKPILGVNKPVNIRSRRRSEGLFVIAVEHLPLTPHMTVSDLLMPSGGIEILCATAIRVRHPH